MTIETDPVDVPSYRTRNFVIRLCAWLLVFIVVAFTMATIAAQFLIKPIPTGYFDILGAATWSVCIIVSSYSGGRAVEAIGNALVKRP